MSLIPHSVTYETGQGEKGAAGPELQSEAGPKARPGSQPVRLVIPATTEMATSSEEEVHQQNCASLEEIPRYAIPN